MSDWNKPIDNQNTNGWTTFARNASRSHTNGRENNLSAGSQSNTRGRGRGRGGFNARSQHQGWNDQQNNSQQSWSNNKETPAEKTTPWGGQETTTSNSGAWGSNTVPKTNTWENTTATKSSWNGQKDWNAQTEPKGTQQSWNQPAPNVAPVQTEPKGTQQPWNQPAPAGSSGWDEKPKENNVQWGAVSLDDLGWSEKNQKASLEPSQGTWKNGVHVLGEDNEKIRLKLFGTLEDKENVHSGINFDKYDNIPVETKGDHVPEAIHDFESSNLDKHLLHNIQLAHFKVPTPVQKYSIPIVMNGHALMACAQTGSGKTAGFLFPILSAMFSNGPLEDPKEPAVRKGYQFYKKSYPQALILAPTRELASQIYKEARKYCYRSYVRPCVAYGGADISAQLRLIDRGCHILIATPGRLVDLLERRRISFKNIQYLVLDEADRMLDMGFEPQVRRIVEGEDMPPPEGRQTLMFSATFPDNIQVLARDFMSSYVFLSVGRVGGTSDNITQEIKWVKEEEKKNHLIEALQNTEHRGLTLVFTQTKRMADSVCKFLNDRRFPATAIHGDRVQSEREEALESFKKGITPILVATAVAARGLDIPNVLHVISFDLPGDIDDYVHRIGRTGRAGNTGHATTFFTSSDRFLAAPMVKLLKDANQQVPEWLENMSKETRSF